MYVTSQRPDEQVIPAYAGSFNFPCSVRPGDKIPVTTVNRTLKREKVTSWRGPKESKHTSHSFDVLKYEITGTKNLWVCNRYGYSEGGSHWLMLLNNHGSLVPRIGWGPDLYKVDATTQQLRNNVVAELYGKANAARFDTAVFIAELAETVQYVTQIFKTVLDLYSLYQGIAGRLINAHSTWLEFRYAVMPMLLTVEDALAAIQPQRPRDKVQNYSEFKTVDVVNHDFTYAYGKLGFTSRTTTKHRCGAALKIGFQHDMAPWGLSLYDIGRAAWEKVKLSFVFDWMLDVGAWLDSFRNTNLAVVDKYATAIRETKLEIWLNEGTCAKDMKLVEYPTYDKPFTVSAYNMIRYIDNAVLPPALPCLQAGPLSLFRKLDALALTIGFLLGIRQRR